jgi:3-phenylpropionate/trans-cinnamate dioxygenase ferredoxin subunit
MPAAPREGASPILTQRRVPLGPADEIPEGQARVYEVGGEYIALCRAGGRFHAVEDRCPHDDGPLGEGCLEGFEIECPRHGARFDVRDGRVLCRPAAEPIRTFAVEVEAGTIYLELPGGGGREAS